MAISDPQLFDSADYFLRQILGNPSAFLPKGAQWIIFFEKFPDVIKRVQDFEPNFKISKWNISNAFDSVAKKDEYQRINGCVFAQAVSLPGESIIISNEGIQYGGLIRPVVGSGRNPFPAMTVQFFDNNTSFVDNIIRPWVIVTSHLGMVAMDGDKDDYRTNIQFYKLGIAPEGRYVRQKFIFYGVCPLSVADEEYNYQPSQAPHIRSATFTYQYYTVDSNGDIAS